MLRRLAVFLALIFFGVGISLVSPGVALASPRVSPSEPGLPTIAPGPAASTFTLSNSRSGTDAVGIICIVKVNYPHESGHNPNTIDLGDFGLCDAVTWRFASSLKQEDPW